MAILGPHALSMSQPSLDQPLIAVRMGRTPSATGEGPWQLIYATPNSEQLQVQLSTLLNGLDEYVQEMKRGDELKMEDGIAGVEPIVWKVFDSGCIPAV